MTDIWSELSSLATQNPAYESQIYPITDQQVLSVVGPDSEKFMQGQFTCNLGDISQQAFRPGACCNAKGRMVSSFNLVKYANHHYLLTLDASLQVITQTHLQKYMVFFKAKMQAESFILVGIQGPDAADLLLTIFDDVPAQDFAQVIKEGHVLAKLPHGAGFQLWLEPNQAQAVLNALVGKSSLSNNDKWNENLIRHGIGHVSAQTSEAFIPQMMNLPQNGGVSFSKGCYTGQEIVARMQYLGKMKRHMYRMGFEPQTRIHSGDEVFVTGQTSPVGVVVSSSHCDQQQQALVVLEDKALIHLAQGAINVGPEQASAKELLSLPYNVIDEQPE